MEKNLPARLDEITLRNDYAFKKIFGTERNKDILTEFISLAIGMNKQDFEDVIIENPDLSAKFFEEKKGRLDIKIKLKNGTKIDVEMQNIYLSHYPKRTLYYWSELFLENFKHGDEYRKLNKTIVINILNEPFPLSNKLHSTFKILETEEHTLFDDVFEIHFFNLSKLKEDAMLHTMEEIERWLMFIKTNKDNVRENLAEGNPIMQKANEELKHFYLTDEDRQAYLLVGHAMSDHASMIGEAKEEGLQQGRKEGLQQGLQQGREEGLQAGKQAMALRMKAKGFDASSITEVTGLTLDEIQEL